MTATAPTAEGSNPGASLTIVNGNWGATSLRAIRAVLESARDVLAEAFGKPPDAPVRVSPWNGAGSLVGMASGPTRSFSPRGTGTGVGTSTSSRTSSAT